VRSIEVDLDEVGSKVDGRKVKLGRVEQAQGTNTAHKGAMAYMWIVLTELVQEDDGSSGQPEAGWRSSPDPIVHTLGLDDSSQRISMGV